MMGSAEKRKIRVRTRNATGLSGGHSNGGIREGTSGGAIKGEN